MTVSVNGERPRARRRHHPRHPGRDPHPAPSGVAAAVNEAVVPRSQWRGTLLGDGDRVEVLTAVQGG